MIWTLDKNHQQESQDGLALGKNRVFGLDKILGKYSVKSYLYKFDVVFPYGALQKTLRERQGAAKSKLSHSEGLALELLKFKNVSKKLPKHSATYTYYYIFPKALKTTIIKHHTILL